MMIMMGVGMGQYGNLGSTVFLLQVQMVLYWNWYLETKNNNNKKTFLLS